MGQPCIDLEHAAEQLGVHYQTAYRWVRSGALKASMVEGRYCIEPDVIARFAEARARPKRPGPRRPRQGFGPLSDRFLERVLANDEGAADQLVRGLLDSGVTMCTVITEVVAPAMAQVGARWAAGRLAIAEEHQATAMVERLLAEHLPTPRGRRRGTAVVAALSGDRHGLPTLMATAALREDNWRVRHLGADLPAEELVRLGADQPIDLVVLTVTAIEAFDAARDAAARLEALGTPVLIGRPGATLADLQQQARERRSRPSTAEG